MKSDFRKFTTHETPCRNFERTTHNNEMHRLTSEDYAVDAVTAAKSLVGAWLCRRLEDGSVVRRRITETEAYGGEDPPRHRLRLQARPKPQVAFYIARGRINSEVRFGRILLRAMRCGGQEGRKERVR